MTASVYYFRDYTQGKQSTVITQNDCFERPGTRFKSYRHPKMINYQKMVTNLGNFWYIVHQNIIRYIPLDI